MPDNVLLRVMYLLSQDVYVWLRQVHIPDFYTIVGGFASDPFIFQNGDFIEVNLVIPAEAWNRYSTSEDRKRIGDEAREHGMTSAQVFKGVVVISDDDGSPSGGHSPESRGSNIESERGFSGGERGGRG